MRNLHLQQLLRPDGTRVGAEGVEKVLAVLRSVAYIRYNEALAAVVGDEAEAVEEMLCPRIQAVVREQVKGRPSFGPSRPVDEVLRRVADGEVDSDEGDAVDGADDLGVAVEGDLVAVDAVGAEVGELRRIGRDEGDGW